MAGLWHRSLSFKNSEKGCSIMTGFMEEVRSEVSLKGQPSIRSESGQEDEVRGKPDLEGSGLVAIVILCSPLLLIPLSSVMGTGERRHWTSAKKDGNFSGCPHRSTRSERGHSRDGLTLVAGLSDPQ